MVIEETGVSEVQTLRVIVYIHLEKLLSEPFYGGGIVRYGTLVRAIFEGTRHIFNKEFQKFRENNRIFRILLIRDNCTPYLSVIYILESKVPL